MANRDRLGQETVQRKKLRKKAKKEHEAEAEAALAAWRAGSALRLSEQLEELTGLESRITILGHLQRGGTPSAADRLLATRLGAACVDLIQKDVFGVMVAAQGDRAQPVPIETVVGKRRVVPLDHPWIAAARSLGTSLGD